MSILRSIDILVQSGLPYEFRTTVVPGLHNQGNLVNLAKDIKATMKQFSWFLQPFRPQNCLDEAYLKKQPFSEKELKEMLQAVKAIIPDASLRGD